MQAECARRCARISPSGDCCTLVVAWGCLPVTIQCECARADRASDRSSAALGVPARWLARNAGGPAQCCASTHDRDSHTLLLKPHKSAKSGAQSDLEVQRGEVAVLAKLADEMLGKALGMWKLPGIPTCASTRRPYSSPHARQHTIYPEESSSEC